MSFGIIHIGAALLIWFGCLLVLNKKKRGFWGNFLIGWGLQVLFSLPAGIWQALKGWPNISVSGFSPLLRLATPFIGWPFNAGGYTVRLVFEATVGHLEWLVGQRSMTVLSNMPYYGFLLFVQGSVLSAFFAWRCKKSIVYDDWFAVCIGLLFLVNSFLNVSWFWAGT
jgi:hypothetical protein